MDKWVIWSNEHKAFWGSGHNGYVRTLQEVDRYSFLEALDICRKGNFPSDQNGYPENEEQLLHEVMCPAPDMIEAWRNY